MHLIRSYAKANRQRLFVLKKENKKKRAKITSALILNRFVRRQTNARARAQTYNAVCILFHTAHTRNAAIRTLLIVNKRVGNVAKRIVKERKRMSTPNARRFVASIKKATL